MPRRRKPTETKRLEKTYRPDRANAAEPKYAPGAPPMPSWLSAGAAAEWERLVPLLETWRVLAETDLAILASYCCAVGDLSEARATLQREGLYYTNEKSGLYKEHPAAKASRELWQQIRLLANELGLTPAARSKVSSIPEAAEQDPMTEAAPRRRASAPPPRKPPAGGGMKRKPPPAIN